MVFSSSSSSSSSSQKKGLHTLLASRLSKLTIPSSSSSSSPNSTSHDFDFSELFGPSTPTSHSHLHPKPVDDPSTSSSSSSCPVVLGDPQPLVIHNRSHSFVGPSPRFASSQSPPSLPFTHEFDSQSEDELETEDGNGDDDGVGDGELLGKSQLAESVGKTGPGDFEILRVVGKGAFGKVFLVRKKSNNCDGGDGIYAMKVMRKDPIIKKNHVDYMKAERDILTKVLHPFVVQLRYSFQV